MSEQETKTASSSTNHHLFFINMRFFISTLLFFAIVVSASISLRAQNTMFVTESEFGKATIFADGVTTMDGQGYSYDKLDDLRTVIRFNTFWSFTDNPEEGLKDEMILQIGRKYSKYYSPLLHAADSALQSGGRQIGFRSKLFANANPVFVNDCYYTDLTSGELTFVCRFATEDFEYTETPPFLNWRICQERKEICGYECRKAIGTFRGRSYEVWYTEDIPASAGPWKLRGLPGVILLAKDFDGLSRFEAVSVTSAHGYIEKPVYPYFKISRKEYRTMLNQYFKTPIRFRSMHMSRAPGIVITPPAKETPLREIIDLEKE